jgi:putative N6-adenine-specific DNA methylase
MSSAPLPLFAACLPGLEPLLADELAALGADPAPAAGGVAFTGDVALLRRAHLWLGTASHLLLRCAEFRCRALGELQRKAALLPWRQWLDPRTPFAVRATARGSRMYHTGAIEERLLAAIAQALDVRPPAGNPPADAIAIAARVHDDVVTLSLDTARTPLHRRGYRLDARKAPLREDLAFALLRAAGFARGRPLLDPFCGSGTIAIEGAAIAAGLPPGRLRPPPLQGTALQDDAAWQALLAALPPPPAAAIDGSPIAASDRDAGAIEAVRDNAQRAGVAAAITAATCAVSAQPWLADRAAAPASGLLATNPPFGVRVRGGDLGSLYQTLGHRARALGDGWTCALLAHDPRLARRTGLPLQVAWATRHGGLRIAAMLTARAGERAPTA